MGQGEDALLPGRQQLFHREFGRGMQVKLLGRAVVADGGGRKGMQMRLVARRGGQSGRVDLQEVLRREPKSQLRRQPRAQQQGRTAVGMAFGGPPGGAGHILSLAIPAKAG